MIDNIPRTRRDALKAGLKKFTPFKVCAKCGQAGEWHVVNGCLSCKRKRTQREHAARILRGPWLATIADTITEARKSSPAWDQHTASLTAERLALVIAHYVTKQRLENAKPSALTVSDDIGRALHIADIREARKAGAALLGFAESSGFIAPLRAVRDGARTLATEVKLSIEADAQRASIESRLAGAAIDDARPMLSRPPPVLVITPNHDGTEKTAPYPNPPDAVLAALVQVQSTAWRVNPFMLATLRALLASGAKLHASKDKHANGIAAVEQALYVSQFPQFFYRCEFDWRGRLYQIGGRLQYTSGADMARGLLEFAHGEPLTSDGYLWLAVHIATCHGHRGSYSDRIVWTHTHHDKILQTAADPLHTATFWRKASEPYQFLAGCDAWRQVTENPHAVIHLPVAADATSSAFQHFALLLRDETLAAKVNVSGQNYADVPADFYGQLATQTDPELTRDQVKKGAWFFYGQKEGTLAKALRGKPKGKQTAAQARAFKRKFPLSESLPWDAARSIRAVLELNAPGAFTLYNALTAAAKEFTAKGLPIRWTLPDGFTVYQANRKTETRQTEIWLHPGPWRLQAKERHLTDALDAGKQARSLPANLIHSLDACLLRAIAREAASVSRWAVAHDSIGVHPNDGGRLRQAIREAVQWMYGPDLLGDVLAEWSSVGVTVERCHGAELPATIAGGWYTFS